MPAKITSFDGSTNNNRIIFNPHDPAHALRGNLEIELVILLDQANANGPIISFGAFDNGSVEQMKYNNLYMVQMSAGKIEVFHEFGNGSNYSFIGPTNLSTDRWHRVKVIRSGLNYFVYLNGDLYFQSSFTSAQAPTYGTTLDPQMALRLGIAYTERLVQSRVSNLSVCFAQLKNESGTVVYTYGEDPGGAPGVAPLELGLVLDVDSLEGVFQRNPQTQKGTEEIEPMYRLVTRGPQRANAYLIDPLDEGNGEGGSEPIKTPRAFPLETQWTWANASQFE